MAATGWAGRRRSWTAICFVLAGLLWLGGSPAMAEPVKVRAAAEKDFARIVFLWDTPVSFRHKVRGKRVTIRFGRPIEASLGRITRALRKYVRAATLGKDGKSVVLTLNGDFDVYNFNSGAAVIVEIVDKAPSKAEKADKTAKKADKPPKKEAKTQAKTAAKADPGKAGPKKAGPEKATRDLPEVRVRSGQHDAYTRIVFDWRKRVPYRFKQQGGIVTVTFDRAARINLTRIQSRPPRYIGGSRARIGEDSVTVTFSVPPTSKIKLLRAGPKVVLDVGRPSGSDTAAPLPAPAKGETVAQAGSKTAGSKTAGAKTAAAKAAPEAARAKLAAGAAAPATPAAPAVPGAGPATKTAAAAKTISERKTAAERTAAAGPATTGPRVGPRGKTPAAALEAARAAAPRAGKSTKLTPTALTPPAKAQGAPGQAKQANAPAAALAGPGAPPALPPSPAQVTAGAGAAPGAVVLKFDWNEPVGAAVFRRAGFLWVAFDKPTAIDVDQLRRAGGNIIKGIQQMALPRATVLRMATLSGVNPTIRRQGFSWLLEFRKQPISPGTPLSIKAQPDSPVGARLFIPVQDPGTPIAVTDPEVGDNLVIVPVIPLGHGTSLEYLYPELRFLPTSQGIVIQPMADNLRVRPLRQGIEITSGTALQISGVSPEAEAASRAAMKPLTKILDLEKWKLRNISDFTPKKLKLLAAIVRTKGDLREAARLDLARFYFANGFGSEAHAVLRRIELDRAEIEDDPEFRMLRGGARYLMGRFAAAAEDFSHESIKENDEAILWNAAVRARSGDLEGAAPELKRTGLLVRPYPSALKLPLGTLVTEAAIKVDDVKGARHFLEILRLEKLTRSTKSQLNYVEGLVDEAAGDFDAAVAKWEEVSEGFHRPTRAKATVARVELLLKLKRMTRADAILELETLRFAWRGDEFEFNLLRRLGGLYMEEGRYRKGLERWRQAATHFRTHPEAPQVTQQMADVFSRLYLEDAADTLLPVTAIAIYDEFKELTPAGTQGDKLIQKLADRLVRIDLLDRAAKLLGGQIRFRLQGVEKARVGAQLALVHIFAEEYDAALKALSETAEAGLSPELLSLRGQLKARSLMGQGKREQALATIKADMSQDAEKLRTEIFWKSHDWINASQSLRRMIKNTGVKPGGSLDEEQAAHLLSYAIALTLSHNERALALLKRDHGLAMDASEFKDAFRLIASPASLGLVDPKAVAAKVKVAENFQSFMAAYRERLKKQNLSDLVPPAGKPAAGEPPAETPPAGTSPAQTSANETSPPPRS